VKDTPEISSKAVKPSKMRIYAMVSAFAVLLLIFVGMFMQMNAQNAKDAALTQANHQAALRQIQSQTQQAAIPTPTVSINQVLQPTAASAFIATADEQKLNFTIQYPSSAASGAAQVKNSLTTFGIKNIESSQEANLSGTQDLVLFTSKVGKATQQRILSVVQQSVPTAISEADDAISSDVLILLK
jgi:hypothetical protein